MAQIDLLQRLFIGRAKYLDEFRDLIQGNTYRVLFVYGPGGIGKTWLLQKMLETSHGDAYSSEIVSINLVDMYSTANHSIEGFQKQIVSLLETSVGTDVFTGYKRRWNDYEKGMQVGMSSDILDGIRDLLNVEFINECSNFPKKWTPVIFLDTFERVQHDPVGEWIMSSMVKGLPDFRFVIASREKWLGNGFVHVRALEGFSLEETTQYVTQRGSSIAANALPVLYHLTQGHPLKMELALEWISQELLHDTRTLENLSEKKFEEALIDPLRKLGRGLFGEPGLDTVFHQIILCMAFLNGRFNADLMKTLVDNGFITLDTNKWSSQQVLDLLITKFPFVKERPDGYIQLHDEMERLVRDYLWPTFDCYGEFRRELAEIALIWYDGQISQMLDARVTNDLKSERLAYQLHLNPQIAYKDFIEIFDQAKKESQLGLCESILNEMSRYEWSGFTSELQYELHKRRVGLSFNLHQYSNSNIKASVNVVCKLSQKEKTPEWQVDAMNWQYTVLWRENQKESIDYLLKSFLPFCKKNAPSFLPKVLYLIGFSYRNQQDLGQAVRWFEKSRNESRVQGDRENLASALNDLGYTYASLGKPEKGRFYVREGLELRQREGNLRQIGLSFNTLGEVYRYASRLAEAEEYYSRAVETFDKLHELEWKAISLQALCDTQRLIALAMRRRGDPQADDYWQKAQQKILDCLDLYQQHGLQREQETAYRRHGRLLRDWRTDYQAARKQFELGLELAKKKRNTLEILEDLQELAHLAAIEGREDDVKLYGSEIGEYRDKIYQWHVFPSLLEICKGIIEYKKGNYHQALEHYISGYSDLAKDRGYGSALYSTHRDRLLEDLKNLPNANMKREWANCLIEKWKAERLTKHHPDLVEYCELRRDNADFI